MQSSEEATRGEVGSGGATSGKAASGRVAFVTGGTKGIGLAIADRLASEGASVAINFLRSKTDAHAAEAHLARHGGKVLAVRGNVGNPEHLAKMFDEIRETFGALDVFVSNAAAGVLKPAMELTPDDWDLTLNVMARSFLLGAQHARPLMAGRRGKMISVSSLGSFLYTENYTAVGAAKAALESVTRYLAVELAKDGIAVNCISAGTTETAALRKFPQHDAMVDDAVRRTPQGRIGTPEDVANVVALLCSEDAAWITGQVIIADGGYSIMM